MKTLFKLTAISAFLAAALMAQRYRPMDAGTPPDPATMAQNQVTRLTAILSLTTAQAAQATTIFTNAANAVTPIQTELNTNRQSIETAIQGNATAAIDQLATAMGGLTGQITAIQSKAQAAFYAILTADQQSKLNQIGPMGMGPMMGPGGPPPGGPPPAQ